MKNTIIILLLACITTGTIIAQDTEATKKVTNSNKSLLGYWILDDGKPVSEPYSGGYLIDNQTNVMPQAQSLEMVIQHRFGSLENGLSDFLGIYGPGTNTRLGLNYSITDWAQVSFGTTKNKMIQDFGLKVNLLKQSRNNNCPLDVTYYGNWSISAMEKSEFGYNYEFANRFAFFNELLLTRKFVDWFTVSVGGSFTHFNQVDSLYDHDVIALHFLGRAKVSPQSSIIINWELPLNLKGIYEWDEIQNPWSTSGLDVALGTYNFGIGYEIATATHVFQIFASSSNYLVPQYNIMKNDKKFFDGVENIFIGFNITRQWNF
jgi:hypothetical protein